MELLLNLLLHIRLLLYGFVYFFNSLDTLLQDRVLFPYGESIADRLFTNSQLHLHKCLPDNLLLTLLGDFGRAYVIHEVFLTFSLQVDLFALEQLTVFD